jgi:hypothetical protein
MDGLIYAVGGSSNAEYHKSVEVYDPDHDSWRTIKPMIRKRLGVGVAVVNRYSKFIKLIVANGNFINILRIINKANY